MSGGFNKGKGIISDSNLKHTYSLAFSRVMSSLTQHYSRLLGVSTESVCIMYTRGKMYVLVNGSLYETIRKQSVDDIFNSMDVNELRRKLKVL